MVTATENIKISDLETDVPRTITIEKDYLYALFNGTGYSSKGINATMRAMRDLTSVTDREVGMDVYSPFRKQPQKRKGPTHILNVPALGDQTSVGPSYKTGKEMDRGSLYFEKDSLFVPIVHLHTHPSHSTIPSEKDYETITGRRINEVFSFQENYFRLSNRLFNIIVGNCSTFLFWRYNENEEAYRRYTQRLSDLSHPIEDEITELMNETGSFTAYHFNDGFKTKLHKNHIDELAELFCPFDITVTRVKR